MGEERGVVKHGEALSIGIVAWFSHPFPLCSDKMIHYQLALDGSNVLRSVAQL